LEQKERHKLTTLMNGKLKEEIAPQKEEKKSIFVLKSM
jgi:hypothetical protein